MRVLVLHNPTAGDGRPAPGELLGLLREAGFEPVYVSSKDAGFAPAMAAPADLVIAAGGDGTVAKLAATLPDRRQAVAILPLGGANNVARSLGIGADLVGLIGALRGAPVRRLDIGTARGPWGMHLLVEGAGLGALALSSADADDAQAAVRDKIRAGREALRRRIASEPGIPLRLALDGDPLAGEFLMVEAVNGCSIGPALPLAPDADPGDGLLDVVCIPADRRESMLAWLDRRPTGEPPPGEVRRCRRLAFTWTGAPLHLDDDLLEPPAAPADVVVEVDPEPLRVLVPDAGGDRPGRPAGGI